MSDSLDALIGIVPVTLAAGVVMKVSDRMLGPSTKKGLRKQKPFLKKAPSLSSKAKKSRKKLYTKAARAKKLSKRIF